MPASIVDGMLTGDGSVTTAATGQRHRSALSVAVVLQPRRPRESRRALRRGILRTLHVAEAFGGGVQEVVATIAAGQADRGDTVAVAHGRRPETPMDLAGALDPRVEVISLGWTSRTPAAQLRAMRNLRRLVSSWRPDVVHLHSSFAGVAGALALPRSVGSVYTPHAFSFTMHEGSRARRALYVWVERLLVRRVSSVGAVSQYEAAAATNVAHAPRVVVVPNGIPELDTPPGAPSGRETRRPRVVTLGRIAPQRRPVESARILAGLADLADPEWVGGGGRGGVPRTAVTDQGVALSGWLSHREAMERLAAATAYLHWSAWDGCPLSVLEAMAYDVVVVGSDIAPLRELLGPAQLCSTEEQAVATLRRVLTDASFRQRLLDEQRRRRAGAGAGRMVDEWRAVYRAIRAA